MTRQHILAACAAFHAAAAKGSAAGESEGTFSRRFPSLGRSVRQPVSLVIAFGPSVVRETFLPAT